MDALPLQQGASPHTEVVAHTMEIAHFQELHCELRLVQSLLASLVVVLLLHIIYVIEQKEFYF